MNQIKILEKIMGSVIILSSIFFMYKTITHLHSDPYVNAMLQLKTADSYGVSVFGICICCGVMIFAGIKLLKSSDNSQK